MTIFAIIPQPHARTDKLGPAIAELYQNDHCQLDSGHGWLIATRGTAKEVSDVLKVTDGTNGAAVIFEIASYYGLANPNIWNWIKEKWGTSGG
jgi:hypothetical protein